MLNAQELQLFMLLQECKQSKAQLTVDVLYVTHKEQ